MNQLVLRCCLNKECSAYGVKMYVWKHRDKCPYCGREIQEKPPLNKTPKPVDYDGHP